MNPFDAWARMATSGLDMWSTALRAGETMRASGEVIGARTPMIEAAMRNPLAADHAELALMVREKGEAFASSGASLAADMMKLQFDLIAQGNAVAAAMMTGRMPGARASRAFAARSGRIATRAMDAGGRALAPVHKTATANAKRLRKKR